MLMLQYCWLVYEVLDLLYGVGLFDVLVRNLGLWKIDFVFVVVM